MAYVDGFVLAVPKDNIDAYLEVERQAREVWLDHGARDYVVALADDVQDGHTTDFNRAVKREPGETVAFAYITYDSRAHRDEVNAKVMADPRCVGMTPDDMPFDGKRMVWGGFAARIGL